MIYALVLALVAVVVVGCAIATGAGAVAHVGVDTEVKREVAASAPVIEEILIDKK